MGMYFGDVKEFLKGVPPFQFLDDAVLDNVVESIAVDFYPKDTVILRQEGQPAEALYIIKKGGVKVSIKTDTGEDIAIDYRGDGESFGLLSLMGNVQKTTVTAIDDTICYLIGKQKLYALIDSTPAFTEYFLQSHFSKYIEKTYSELHSKSLFYGSSDHVLFTTRIGEIAIKDIVKVPEGTKIRDAAQVMSIAKVSSVIVVDKNNLPTGIITDRDLREKVVAKGRDVNEPVENIKSLPLIRVDAKDYCFEAVFKMIKHNIHHMLVIKDGDLRGVITNHDLMLLQGKSPLSFVKDIESQHTLEGLITVAGKINRVVSLLLKEGARAGNITKIISELNDRLVRKVLEIIEKKLGEPPLPFCWIVFGSEGRKEQTFKTDQDNAIIYADTESPALKAAAEKYFSDFGLMARDSLVKCGFPLCPADNMASNPEWRQPLSAWKKYFSGWITKPAPDSVLKSLIFFDFRPLYGDFGLADELRSYLNNILKDQNIFFAKIASLIAKNRPPLGFFKTFIVEKGGEHKDELNLKINGAGPLVDIIRLFALETGISATPTLERIEELKDKNPVIRERGDELAQAFEFITLLRIHHQMEQIESGKEPDNFINPARLSSLEKKSLKEAFQIISKIMDAIADQYGPGMVGG
jgi:CBS domain-containing protein